MKIVVFPILLLAGIVGTLQAFPHLRVFASEWSSHREHAKLIDRAFKDRLVPTCVLIRSFVAREHRLPTDSEMESINQGKSGWDMVTIIRDRPSWLSSWGVVGTDFIVVTSEPEWNLYYCSWNNKRIEAWTD